MSRAIVNVARCPEHGLHGARVDCYVCGGPVEQVPMASLEVLAGDREHGPFDPDELVMWAEHYGHPEHWAKLAQTAHMRAERLAEELRRATAADQGEP